MNAELMRELLTRMGTTNPTLATLGSAMATVWRRRERGRQLTLVLPVVDRGKFVAALRGTKGADGDAVAGLICKPLDGRYVCAQRRETLAGLGRRGLDPVRARILRAAMSSWCCRILPPGVTTVAALDLERGAAIARAMVRGLRRRSSRRSARRARRARGPTQRQGSALSAAAGGWRSCRRRAGHGCDAGGPGARVAGPITYVVGGGATDPAIRIPLRDCGAVEGGGRALRQLVRRTRILAEVHDGACRVTLGATWY